MTIDIAPPSRRAVRAAWAAAASATLGFVPLHLAWALGFPLFADPELFRDWHDDGGRGYLLTLNALAVLPAVLALALVQSWGLRFPRRLLVVAGTGLGVFLLLYTLYAAVLGVVLADAENAVFSPWTVVYGVPQFLIWAGGLLIATRSYAARTRPADAVELDGREG
jgi:hypothetical protein